MLASREVVILLLAITFAAPSALAKEVVQTDKDGIRLVLGTSTIPETVGEMVPVSATFEKSPLKEGDTLSIFADSTHLAYVVTPSGGFLLRAFAARVRMNEGTLKMLVTRADGTTTELVQRIAIDRPFVIPKSGDASKEFRVRGKGNSIELIHRNRMAIDNYVSHIILAVSVGRLSISMTPYSSGLAYYRIEADHSLEGGTIEMQIADKPYDAKQ